MKVIEREVVGAFLRGEAKSRRSILPDGRPGGTVTDGQRLYLHGSLIAERREDGSIWGTLAGYPTVVTRSRLNAVADMLPNGRHVNQRNHFQWVDDDMLLDSYQWYQISDPRSD